MKGPKLLDISNKSSDVALLTFATLEYSELLKLSGPLMKEYAKHWNFDFFELNRSLDSDRPISWSKLIAIQQLLEDYTFVIYLDADVMILNFDRNILDLMNGKQDFAWRVTNINGKPSPNAGVMIFRSSPLTLSMIDLAYAQSDLIFDGWWEQAALIRVLGYADPRQSPMSEKPRRLIELHECLLPANWNATGMEKCVGNPYIRHFAGLPIDIKKLMMIETALNLQNKFADFLTEISADDLIRQYQETCKELQALSVTWRAKMIFRFKSILHKLKLRKLRYN